MYGSDPPTVTNRWRPSDYWLAQKQYNSSSAKVHWQSWWNCENVALFPFSYFSRYVPFLFCCWKQPLYGIVVCNVTAICFVYLAFSSFTLLLKAACVVFFSFLWSDAFYQSNRFAAVFEWPRTSHTHLATVQTQNKCTDNQRERDKRGRGGARARNTESACRPQAEKAHWPRLHAPGLSSVCFRLSSCPVVYRSLSMPVTEPVWCY